MAGDQREQVAALFDRLADSYDNVGVDFFQPIADGLVAELAPRAGEHALDVGCGRGAVLLPLARAVGEQGSVVGIDLSPGMVAVAREEVVRAGLSVEVRVGDAQAPDFGPGSFDLIASSLVLFFLPDPRAALEAWRALLVPGGRVGVATFGEHTTAWHSVDEVFAPFLPPGMADPRSQTAGTVFASDSGMEQFLVDAGFGSVRTVTMTVSPRFDDEDHWHRWTWSIGQRRMWEMIPADQRDGVRAAAYERLDACRDAEGRIGFDQVARFTLGVVG